MRNFLIATLAISVARTVYCYCHDDDGPDACLNGVMWPLDLLQLGVICLEGRKTKW